MTHAKTPHWRSLVRLHSSSQPHHISIGTTSTNSTADSFVCQNQPINANSQNPNPRCGVLGSAPTLPRRRITVTNKVQQRRIHTLATATSDHSPTAQSRTVQVRSRFKSYARSYNNDDTQQDGLSSDEKALDRFTMPMTLLHADPQRRY